MITPREMQIAYETGLFYYIFFLGPLNASLGVPPAAHSGRCTMRGEQPRNQKRPKSDGTAANGDCTCSKENRRDPKDRNGIREPAVRAMQRFPHTRPIAPPRSGSTRPGLEIRFYSLASYFGLPDIRHNEARSALSERSDVRQGDIRTGPDHRTNYPNIASRNAEGRGGEAAGTENPAEDTASAPPDSGKGPAAPVRTGTRAASEIHPPPGMQPRAPESVQLLATAVPAVRLEARTHTNSFEKHIRSRRSRTFARFTKPEQIPGGTPRPPLQTISTDSRIVIRTG